MRNLMEVYESISSKDAELEKQAGELVKQAEEEDAAGRIMARGFADELHKLAGNFNQPNTPIASGGYATGGGKTQGAAAPARRPMKAPAAPSAGGGGTFTGKNLNPASGALKPPGAVAAGGAAKPSKAPKPVGG